jgi:TolA-binding protein
LHSFGQTLLAQGENGFSDSITMFSALAAINAAGYDTGMDSPLNEQYHVRTQVRELLSKETIPSLPELRAFYQQHKKPSEAADLGQYLSFSLLAGGPPDFKLPDNVPGDVEPLRGFSELLAAFYQQAKIEDLWKRSQPALNAAMGQYQDAVIATLFETNGYLRNPSGYLGRRFQIYLDLLGAPNQVQVRSYKDDYFVVITPTNTPVVDQIRDAYLEYLLDPLTFKYSEIIKEKRPLAKYADEAPALDLVYKDDFSLLVTKCLVKAIDSRLLHGGEEKREQFVNQAMREGFILTTAFANSLTQYEKQQDSFQLYYPALVGAIDVKREEKRIKTIAFVQQVKPQVAAPPAKMQLDPAEETLETAEGLLDQRDYEAARKGFEKTLHETADKAKQARADYGLAVINLGEKRWDEALNLFHRTVDASPTSAIAAWSHYYLGQLELKRGDKEKAAEEFKLTLAMESASSRARDAAEKALTSSSGEFKQ